MSFSAGTIVAAFVLGLVGLFLLLYGKKTGHFWFIVIGIALNLVPFVIADPLTLWGVGIGLTALAWFLR